MNFFKTEEEIYHSLKKISEIGFKAIQISGIGKIHPKRLKEICDEFGLKICATHIPFERLKEEIESVY